MSALVLAQITIVILIIIIICLSYKTVKFKRKIRYVDEANMWHRLAITDALTELYNRYAYDIQIDKIKQRKSKKTYGIILFDVDDFKKINDTRGHLMGDKVLKIVSQSLLKFFPQPKYKVFRIGGDEFSVIFKGVSENDVIKRLLLLREQLENDSNIYLSKGYAFVDNDVDEAFKSADEMLYADKLSKKKL